LTDGSDVFNFLFTRVVYGSGVLCSGVTLMHCHASGFCETF